MKIPNSFSTSKRVFFFLLLVFAVLGQACRDVNSNAEQAEGTLEALDEKNGFKDAKFGMPLTAFEGLIPDAENQPDNSHQSYTTSLENKALGSIPLSLLKYTFYKGNLIAIEFRVEGEDNSYKLLKALETAYGPGKETAFGPIWEGSNVTMNTIKLKDDEHNKIYLRVDIDSKKMRKQNIEDRKNAQKRENERNANDL